MMYVSFVQYTPMIKIFGTCMKFKCTKHITLENISYQNYRESVCKDVDTCFLVIPNGIVKVVKTLQQGWIT